MKKALTDFGPVILLSLIIFILLQGAFRPTIRFEYKTLSFFDGHGMARQGVTALGPTSIDADEKTLNEEGKSGWEVIGSYLESETAFPSNNGLTLPNVRPQRLVLVLKRQVK